MIESIEQAKGLIRNAKNVAIVLPTDFTLDSYLAAISLFSGLAKTDKKISLYSDNTNNPRLSFVPPDMKIKNHLGGNEELVIKVDTKEAKPGELRYEMKEDGLYVYLKSKQGLFGDSDVTVTGAGTQVDLIVVIGAKAHDELGELYKNSSAIFAQTPLLVIDTNPANEQYGLINLVQVSFSSNCELVMELLKGFDDIAMDSVVATYLLAGIISSTSGFTEYQTSPSTMQNASRLLQAGADKQMIIKDFYKTKNLPTLQLWGRMLARVVDAGQGIMYTTILLSDFTKTNSSLDSLPEAFKDLVEMASDFHVIATITETHGGARLLLAIKNALDIRKIAKDLNIIDHGFTALNKKYNYIDATIQGIGVTEIVSKVQSVKI